MAWLENNHGRLLVGFRFRGERCREYLGLDDNRDNRHGARTSRRSSASSAGKFDYAARFPESRTLKRFGITPQAQVPTPTPVEVEEKPEVPSLGKFADC